MAFQQKRFRLQRPLPVLEVADEFVPTYKEPRALQPFLTAKGKILPRSRTTLSQKRQKRLVIEIKRARQLGLLPYVTVLK